MNKELPECPECDRMAKVSEVSQKIGEFLEWLESKDFRICQWVDGTSDAARIAAAFSFNTEKMDELDNVPNEGYYPITTNIEKLLAEYFEIDLNKVEKERRALLEALR